MAAPPREQVFISSTFIDLKDERQAVTKALLQAKAFPAGMELFPAADTNSWGVIEKAIDDSDYYVLIIGARYGSVDSATNISFTEREYAYADETGKPIMAFIHENPDSVPRGKTDKNEALAKQLDEFKKRVQSDRQIATWTTPADLAGKVVLSLNEMRQTHPAVGWVRGDQAVTDEQRRASDLQASQLEEALKRVSELEQMTMPTDLAQANDEYCIHGMVTANPPSGKDWEPTLESWQASRSWDAIFRRLAPQLFGGATTHILGLNLSEWISSGRYRVDEDADEPLPDDVRLSNFEIDLDSLYDILFQLDALGLVETNSGAHWTMTSRGRHHLRSTAFKRPTAPERAKTDD